MFDNDKCERCGSKDHLSSVFMDYRMGLVRLCIRCHANYHSMLIREEERFMKEVKKDAL